MMYRPLYVATFVTCLGVAGISAATSSPPAPPPETSHARAMQVKGRITRFLINPNGDVDGLLLDDRTQVTFPPHVGAQLTAKRKEGDRVSIDGARIGTLPLIRAATIELPDGDKVTDAPPAPPVTPPGPPPALQPMDAQGRVAQPLYGPRGDIAGAILDSGPIIRVPPPVALGNPLLRPGAPLSARGFGVDTPHGRALQATALGATPGDEQPVAHPPRAGDLPPPPPTPPAPPQS
jgi:hypothetical protein